MDTHRRDPEPHAADGCARVRSRLERYLDGALTPLESALDRGHLEACAECRAEEERWTELHASVRAATAPPAAELAFAREGLADRIAAAPRPRFALLRGRLLLPVATAAAALVALFAAELASPRLSSLDTTDVRRDVLSRAMELSLPSWDEIVGSVLDGEVK
jgi:anti-sigma factor RsiW